MATPTLRDLLRDAAHGDFHSALQRVNEARETVDIPDWGAVKLAAIAVARGCGDGEKILKEQFEYGGGASRVPRKATVTEEQIGAALQRIIDMETKEGSVDCAARFYSLLVGLRFTANKDVFIARILDAAVRRSVSFSSLVSLFTSLFSLGRVKSISQSAYIVKKAVSTDEELRQAAELLADRLSPSIAVLVDGFILLESGEGLQYADQLHSSGHKLSTEHLRILIDWASKWKKPKVLEQLLLNAAVFRFDPSAKGLLYDALVVLYGKKSDTKSLELLIEHLLLEPNWRDFLTTFSRIRHFYKCMNVAPPETLKKLEGRNRD